MKALKLADELKTVNDTEKIKSKLRTYLDRVEKGLEQENEFLHRELTKKHKKNSSIVKALEEMSDTERKAILKEGGTMITYSEFFQFCLLLCPLQICSIRFTRIKRNSPG